MASADSTKTTISDSEAADILLRRMELHADKSGRASVSKFRLIGMLGMSQERYERCINLLISSDRLTVERLGARSRFLVPACGTLAVLECLTCRWFQPERHRSPAFAGECCRYAPILKQDGEGEHGEWPQVFASAFCGEHSDIGEMAYTDGQQEWRRQVQEDGHDC